MTRDLRCAAALAFTVTACVSIPAAQAASFVMSSTSAADGASASVGASSHSVQRSSQSSSPRPLAAGEYRVTDVAAADASGKQAVTLEPVTANRLAARTDRSDRIDRADRNPGAEVTQVTDLAEGTTPRITLLLPPQAVAAGALAAGQRVRAAERPYGIELARADTRDAFFLLLDDPWLRELRSVPLGS